MDGCLTKMEGIFHFYRADLGQLGVQYRRQGAVWEDPVVVGGLGAGPHPGQRGDRPRYSTEKESYQFRSESECTGNFRADISVTSHLEGNTCCVSLYRGAHQLPVMGAACVCLMRVCATAHCAQAPPRDKQKK